MMKLKLIGIATIVVMSTAAALGGTMQPAAAQPGINPIDYANCIIRESAYYRQMIAAKELQGNDALVQMMLQAAVKAVEAKCNN